MVLFLLLFKIVVHQEKFQIEFSRRIFRLVHFFVHLLNVRSRIFPALQRFIPALRDSLRNLVVHFNFSSINNSSAMSTTELENWSYLKLRGCCWSSASTGRV